MRPNVAASQNIVEPPLPRMISHPSGRPNSSVSPDRTLPTRSLTGACRCEVPIIVVAASEIAVICSPLTFDGPQPKRPSAGRSSDGIVIAEGSTPQGWQAVGATTTPSRRTFHTGMRCPRRELGQMLAGCGGESSVIPPCIHCSICDPCC